MKQTITVLFFLVVSLSFSQQFESYINKADSFASKRELHSAVSYYKKALNLKPEKLIVDSNEVLVFSKLGDAYFELADYNSALENFFVLLEKDYVKSQDSLRSTVYNRIGRCYGNLKQYDQALKFYLKTKEEAGSCNKTQGVAHNNIADVYLQMNKLGEAKTYFKKAQEYFKKANYIDGLIVTNINLGLLAQEENKIEFAEQFLKKAESLAIEKKDTSYIVISQIYLAEYYVKISNYDNAEKHLQWTLENAKKNNMPQYITESYEGFVNLYESQKDYKKAYEYMKLFKASSDSIFNLNSNRNYAELEAKYSIREKEKENELLKKEQHFTETQVHAQQKYIWMLSALVIFAILFMGLFFYQRIKRTKVRQLLEAQNKEIKKSQKQMEDLNRQYEKLIAKYEGGNEHSPEVEIS